MKKQSKFLIAFMVIGSLGAIIVFSYEEKIRFDMRTGKSLNYHKIIGIEIGNREINRELKEAAESYNLLENENPVIEIRNDQNMFFLSQTSYSIKKSKYFDLVGLSKIPLHNNSNEDKNYLKKKFKLLWNSLKTD